MAEAALQATVRDVSSNPVSGVSVTFAPPGSGASGTFAGNRTTLNNEFTSVLNEITRQAGNIGLASGGTTSNTGTIGSSQYNNAALAVFIGGGDTGTATDNQVTIDLTNGGAGGVTVTGVDATGLGLAAATVATPGGATTALLCAGCGERRNVATVARIA